MKTLSTSYRRHRYPPQIISHAVWLYHRFSLSFRDVEDLLAQRGVEVSYEIIRRWCLKFGPGYAARAKRRQPRLGDTWHQDKVFMKDRRSPSASSCQRQAVPSTGVFSLAGGDVRPVIINDQTAELRSTVVNVTMPGYGTVNLMVSERIRPRNDCSLSAVSIRSSASARARAEHCAAVLPLFRNE